MRAYSSNSFKPPKRGGGKPWAWILFVFIAGVVLGIIIDQRLSARKPIELIVSAPFQEVPQESEYDKSSSEIWSDSGNISVRSPQPNGLVASPLIVEGMERTFEQNVVLRLRDGNGNELVKLSTTGTAPDVGIHGLYRAELIFEQSKTKTKTGTLEVFQSSAKDGSEIDKVTIQVRFPAQGGSASGGE